MRHHSLSTFAIALATSMIASGCGSDSPVAPQSAVSAPAAASHDLLGSLITVTPLLRTTPLPANLTTSAYIDILGGTLSLPGAGLTVVVPPLSVTSATLITVTALAGSNLAYEFAPHGLQFLVPLVAMQDLHNTQVQSGLVNANALQLGYFPDDNSVTSVSQLLGVNVNLSSLTATSAIWHFSGYIYASGTE